MSALPPAADPRDAETAVETRRATNLGRLAALPTAVVVQSLTYFPPEVSAGRTASRGPSTLKAT